MVDVMAARVAALSLEVTPALRARLPGILASDGSRMLPLKVLRGDKIKLALEPQSGAKALIVSMTFAEVVDGVVGDSPAGLGALSDVERLAYVRSLGCAQCSVDDLDGLVDQWLRLVADAAAGLGQAAEGYEVYEERMASSPPVTPEMDDEDDEERRPAPSPALAGALRGAPRADGSCPCCSGGRGSGFSGGCCSCGGGGCGGGAAVRAGAACCG